MRFEELTLEVPDDRLQLRFHAHLTVLSGLGPLERKALSDSLVGALAGGPEKTALRYLDGTGQAAMVVGRDGRVSARLEDGTPVREPVPAIAPDAVSLRDLILTRGDDLGVPTAEVRADEPAELREARATLEELGTELHAALSQRESLAGLQRDLEAVSEELAAARDGAARREYAMVLAQLERVRAEAAALHTDEAGIEADRNLLDATDSVREVARQWTEAAELVQRLQEAASGSPLSDEERERLAALPEAPPPGLGELIDRLGEATRVRDEVDQRLQDLAVASLPAPSDPLVAELGVLDQDQLWTTADRLGRAEETLHAVQLSLGGLEVKDLGPAPRVIEEIEAAHLATEAADRAVDAARLPGMATVAMGLVAALAGLVITPVLSVAGLAAAVIAAAVAVVRPRARQARCRKVEEEALSRAGATSYLSFHIRRVDASVDPKLRQRVDSATSEHREARAGWEELVGPEVDVDQVRALADEVRAYNRAMQDLGETAHEMEHLRRELEQSAIPGWSTARQAVAEVCAPFLLADADLDGAQLMAKVEEQCRRGTCARAQADLHDAEVTLEKRAAQLDERLQLLGFDDGELPARVGAVEWAIARAEEREDARRRARPRAEIDAELTTLQEEATRLRRPEWIEVSPAEADSPDIVELEAREVELTERLAEARAEVDIDRLADRHAAVERRVASLEARYGDQAPNGDPGALADMQQHLLARLTTAAHAGPHGDPVPVVLDEPFQRVPADRRWDLLDMVLRLAERHQMIYLTDDAFVAAWARQRALDGSITLLEPVPEPV